MLTFPDNLILENDRVLLRPLQQSDLDYFIPFAENEPETFRYSLISPVGRANMEKYVLNTLEQREKKIEFPFIVYDKVSKAYAGCTRFYDIQLFNATTQLGYTWYGKKFQRTGLNRHCKLLLLTYAFESWGMERVELRADARNEASINAMKGIGCTVEGILRSNLAFDTGERRDSIILSILKNEWLNGVKENLLTKVY